MPARPAIEWYPFGRIIAWAALIAGGLVALLCSAAMARATARREAVFDEMR